MFIGHFAVGLAAKRVAPKVPLALLLPAPLLLDLLWPLFFFGGIEHFDVDPSQRGFLVLQLLHVPWTHGLLTAVFWSLVVAVPYFAWRRDGLGSATLGALVFSHWLLDFITHTPDLPVTPWGAERLGLGLWTSPGGTLLVEGLLFVGCVAWYARGTQATSRRGAIALWSLIALVTLIHLGNVFGPPPPSNTAVAAFALAAWITPWWGKWIDASRPVRGPAAEVVQPAGIGG